MVSKKNTKHYRRLHMHRFSWLVFMLVGLLGVQMAYNFQLTGTVQVLAYATDVNHADLHSLTNKERAANGLGALSLNSRLNQAAQAKAQHMIDYDYWSHVAPDGTTPWYFFDQAGYAYINAGENLAYGFLTSSGAVQGWMDSPGHRANILGDYKDVGFGYANGASYQGGENTVIVALYGTPQAQQEPAPVVATAPPAPAPEPTPPPTPAPVEPAPKKTLPPPKKEAPPKPVVADKNTDESIPPAASENVAPNMEETSLISSLLAQNSAWAVIASFSIICITAAGFIATHIQLARHGWDIGAKYVLAHPLTDIVVMGSIVLLFLSATSGFIQ